MPEHHRRDRAALRSPVIALAVGTLAVFGLSACADSYGPAYYSPYQQGQVARVERGTVVSFRPISFGPGDTSGGTIIGGVSGAVVGSAVAGRGSHGVGALLGGLGGALIGNAVASNDHHPGFAYLVRMHRDSREVEIAQADPSPFPVGSRVVVTYSGGRARVEPDLGGSDAIPPPPPPPPPPPRY